MNPSAYFSLSLPLDDMPAQLIQTSLLLTEDVAEALEGMDELGPRACISAVLILPKYSKSSPAALVLSPTEEAAEAAESQMTEWVLAAGGAATMGRCGQELVIIGGALGATPTP